MSPPLLLARPGPLAAVPAAVPRGLGAALWAGPPDLDGALSGARAGWALAAAPRRPARPGGGGLRQRTPPRPPACPEVPGPLYPPWGHFHPSSRGLGGRPGDLPLQGSLNLSEFVVGRSWSVGRGVRRNEAPLFSRNWLENGEETCSSRARVFALQTAINLAKRGLTIESLCA